ncbi:hypothetical protein [Kribbella sp. NBC_00359]|uniref:hypothetical protein n=1 Tax=Kribbella sp. NBC_00359 TaxID=2975966 RepID=UPI002E1E0837
MKYLLYRLILFGGAEPCAGASAVPGQGEVGCDEPTLDCPPQESVGDQAGAGACGDPPVEMSLLQLTKVDAPQ